MRNTFIKIIGLVLLVVCTTLITLYFARKFDNQTPAETQQPETRIPVVVSNLKTRDFQRFVAVQANLESKNFAIVSPKVGGTIEQFFVDEGDTVIAGETKLFITDPVNLQRAVEIQKNLLTVANSQLQQAIANLEKTQADFNKAEIDFNRFKRLFEKKVITADAFEQQQSRYNQLQAAVKAAEAAVALARANIEKTKSDLAIAEKNLADATVYAPISGRISKRFKEPGEMAGVGEPAIRIDDPNVIEVSAFLPAVYYPEVNEGQTKIEVSVAGKNYGEYPVSYKSPTINPKLRTFEVKCLLENPDRTIAAGAMAEIRVILETRKGFAVPSEAIQIRDNKPVIFTVVNGKAHKVAVEKGIENNGWTEVRADELNEQSTIVVMGQNMLDEAKAVSVQKEAR